MANELAIINPTADNVGKSYCSIKRTGDRAADARIFSALNNPDCRVSDFINKRIDLANVLVEVRELFNDETGELNVAPRVVLIDADGKSYQAVSKGLLSALQNAYLIFGEAPWDPPLTIEIKQKPVKNGSMLTFIPIIED